MTQPAWNKSTEVLKTNQISKAKQINKYSDSYNFWVGLFGEYEIFPEVQGSVDYEERDIALSYEERKIELDLQERKIDLSYEEYIAPITNFS